MSHAKTATRAADLAERIVDEISRSGQDWRTIERHARGLAELAASQRELPRPGPRRRKASVSHGRRRSSAPLEVRPAQ